VRSIAELRPEVGDVKAVRVRAAVLAVLALVVAAAASATVSPSSVRATSATTGDKGFWSGIATATDSVGSEGFETVEKVTVTFGVPGGSVDNTFDPQTWFQPFAMSASHVEKTPYDCSTGEAKWAPDTKVTGNVHSVPSVGLFEVEAAALSLSLDMYGSTQCAGTPVATRAVSVNSAIWQCGPFKPTMGICNWSDGAKTVSADATVREYRGFTGEVFTGSFSFTRLPDCDSDGMPDIHDKDDTCTHAPPPPPAPATKKKVLREPWKGTAEVSAKAEHPIVHGSVHGQAGFTLSMRATFDGRARGSKKDALGTLKWTFSAFNTWTPSEGGQSCTWKGTGSYPVITQIYLADDPDDELPPSRAFIFGATGIVPPVQWGILNKDCVDGTGEHHESKVYYANEGPGVKGVEFNIPPSARRVSKAIHPAVSWFMGEFRFPPGATATGRITFSKK